MDLEEELGAQLFERRPRGVRLTAAGEVFVHYLREQDGGVERMKSQIEDLKGLRRGTVRIACSQALALDFLPREIAAFRARHPMVSFGVSVLDHEQAMTALADYEVDLVPVFRPPPSQLSAPDESRAAHRGGDVRPASLATHLTVRLRDCANYPVALPERSLGGRQLLDQVVARSGLTFQLAAESNSFEFLRGLVTHANLISFQIGIGTLPGEQQAQAGRPRHRRPRCPAREPRARTAARPQPADSGGYIRGKARARARGDAGETRRLRRIRCGSGVRQSLKQESRIDGQNVARRT
jgi:DNA-binding transcriptional LysR family regulator